MKNYIAIACLALVPGITYAHEGIDPANIWHTIAHLGESYGLLAAIPVALVIMIVVKRKHNSSDSSDAE